MAIWPTAPLAPSTRTVSPSRSSARHSTESQPARPAMPRHEATAGSTPSGSSIVPSSSTAATSAKAPSAP